MYVTTCYFHIIVDVVTSIQGQSYYCRSINTADPGGLCIMVTPKIVFAASYRASKAGCAPQAIPAIIEHMQQYLS